METKSSVVKSKSSNSAKTNRSEHRNKKSWSNGEFQPHVLKKRGVYVEKKPTKMSIDEPAKNQAQERSVKAPPRPRPGNKKFLASVLTILSKSTTGTQYPDADDHVSRRRTKRRATVRRKDDNFDNYNVKEVKIKSKAKYRSKALNDEVDKEATQEKIVVLQAQKDMIQTPSIYSENDSFNWSNLPLLVKKNKETIDNNVKEVANELAREIMEGRKSRKDKKVRIDEPNTLIADNTKKQPAETGANEKDKGLYNFFVDLLETTISDYNVKAEYNKMPNPPSEASSAKIPLEIDELVAKKLHVGPPESQKAEEAPQPLNQFYCLKDLEFEQRGYSSPPARGESSLKCPRKMKYKAESFSLMNRPAPRKLRAESVVETRKSFSRKEKKKTLLNLFKEQLRMDDDAFEEPQNLYQALKVIAQNKRRCQKTIHFEDSLKKRNRDMGFPECMFKSRKVISPSTKSTKNKNKKVPNAPSIAGKFSEISSIKKKQKTEYETDCDESYHSLEVYGFDYESPTARKPKNIEKQLVFTYHSTPSASVHDLGSKDVQDFSETDSMVFNDFYN